MGLSLESMAIQMPAVFGHPNRVGFKGVLTRVDEASDKAPAGARGHRVMLTKRAAEAAIPSLLGMALDYSPRLDAHDTRRKIGLITQAEITGREIMVGGFLYGRDFPEIVAEIGKAATSAAKAATDGKGLTAALKRCATQNLNSYSAGKAADVPGNTTSVGSSGVLAKCAVGNERTGRSAELRAAGANQMPANRTSVSQALVSSHTLGMSYEITDAVVEDIEATIWVLKRVTFTGAAVLRRDKAAYHATWIELE